MSGLNISSCSKLFLCADICTPRSPRAAEGRLASETTHQIEQEMDDKMVCTALAPMHSPYSAPLAAQ